MSQHAALISEVNIRCVKSYACQKNTRLRFEKAHLRNTKYSVSYFDLMQNSIHALSSHITVITFMMIVLSHLMQCIRLQYADKRA